MDSKIEKVETKRRLDLSSDYVQSHYKLTDDDLCVFEFKNKPPKFSPMNDIIERFLKAPSVITYGVRIEIFNKEDLSRTHIKTPLDYPDKIKFRCSQIADEIKKLKKRLKLNYKVYER